MAMHVLIIFARIREHREFVKDTVIDIIGKIALAPGIGLPVGAEQNAAALRVAKRQVLNGRLAIDGDEARKSDGAASW